MYRIICYCLLGWYYYTLQDKGGEWVTFEDGAIGVSREIIVCHVEQVHFISKENPWFSSQYLRGGHNNGPREEEIHQRLAITKEYFKVENIYGFT